MKDNNSHNENQLNILDNNISLENTSKKLEVINATFNKFETLDYSELFEGFNQMYAITFSTGIDFMYKLLEKFNYAEVIFGNEKVIPSGLKTIMAVQGTLPVYIAEKFKKSNKIGEMIENETLNLYVAREFKSHEKIYILKAKDGRTRVITGSANMSSNAFNGFQREDIIYFDDNSAYEYFINRFQEYRDTCSDKISKKVYLQLIHDKNYLKDNIENIPIINNLNKNDVLILENDEESNEELIVTDISNFQEELKEVIPPKTKAENKKIIISKEQINIIKKKHTKLKKQNEELKEMLPKLHIDYDKRELSFNGEPFNLRPSDDEIKSDLEGIIKYFEGINEFYGTEEEKADMKKDLFDFMNWFFSSIFMPRLRYEGYHTYYNNTYYQYFPVVGILYNIENSGKTTFVKLLTKLMCGKEILESNSSDFTATEVEKKKYLCEGVPILYNDLDKDQYNKYSGKIVKNDIFGIKEKNFNYPSIVITTNKISEITKDISKRTVAKKMEIKIDEILGKKLGRTVNKIISNSTTALFCEYVRLMFDKVDDMIKKMNIEDNDDYEPDIFLESSKVLVSIFKRYYDVLPEYVSTSTCSDNLGDNAIAKKIRKKILMQYENEPELFSVNKKENKLIYKMPEGGSYYVLRDLTRELPSELCAKLNSKTIVMNLKESNNFFGIKFKNKKSFFSR